MKKGMIAFVCMLLTLVFILIGMIGPWYVSNMKTKISIPGYAEEETEVEASVTLTSVTGKVGDEDPETKSIADVKKEAEDAGADTGVYDVVINTFYIVIIAFIIALLAVIGFLGKMFNFGKPAMMNNLSKIFSILTFVFAIIAVLYFMVSVPAETNDANTYTEDVGFWYSKDISEQGQELSISLGPGYAWYLMLVGAILALVATILLFLDKGSVAAPAQ